MPSTEDRIIAQAIRQNAQVFAEVCAAAATRFARWEHLAGPRDAGWRDTVREEFGALPDYLERYLRSANKEWLGLFAGERLKAFHSPEMTRDEWLARATAACAAECTGVADALRLQLAASALERLLRVLGSIHAMVADRSARPASVLMVGDCLLLDTSAFMVGPLRQLGLSPQLDYLPQRSVAELRRALAQRQEGTPDAIFFSPFTYEFLPGQRALMDWRHGLWSAARVEEIVLEMVNEVGKILDYLAARFDCPIFVHNHSGALRHENPVVRAVKLALTMRPRSAGARLASRIILMKIEEINRSTFRHVHVLDEVAEVRRAGVMRAGGYFYRTKLQHPAQLGRLLAPLYTDRVHVAAQLLKRKLVVCDLDNTLWDGVIGEGGGVTHFHERQAVLQKLRARGVVLAILSKNDPAKVHWTGGTLSQEDFVTQEISWDPKVRGMKRIAQALNLKTKDFVFIDDRPDERELMQQAYPEVLALDATAPQVWQRMALWAELLDPAPEMDRTLMYRQREARIGFTGAEEGEGPADAELFHSLELRIEITTPESGELKRVAELINRTNQFNLEGSRSSFAEIRHWAASSRHHVLVARTRDRFGDMGVTCVAICEVDGQRARLLPFVLSCRVFGYGIERAVMNELKRRAHAAGAQSMEGRYVPTPSNQPCQHFLSENGFLANEGSLVCDLDAARPAAAPWLQIDG
jgi:FkbH-like protein